jgi:hypothetical protein
MLAVTSQRLLFEPIQTYKDTLLGPVMSALGLGTVGSIAKTLVEAPGTLEKLALPLGAIAAVTPAQDDALRVTSTGGEAWDFRLTAGMWSVRGSAANTRARDEAVAAIVAAARGVSAPAPPAAAGPVVGAPQPAAADLAPFEEEVRRAVTTGQPVLMHQEGALRFYAAPDGTVRAALGFPRQMPPIATHPGNLTGIFRWPSTRPDEYFALLPSGVLTGAWQLFGAVPPLPVAPGIWWWEQPRSMLWTSFALATGPEVSPRFVVECNLDLLLTYVGDDGVVAQAQTGDPAYGGEIRFTRG